MTHTQINYFSSSSFLFSELNSSIPKFEFLGCYTTVKHFLENNSINDRTQKELETFLYDKSVEISRDSKPNFLIISTELRKTLLDLLPKWDTYITNLKTSYEVSKSIKNKEFNKLTNTDKRKSLFLDRGVAFKIFRFDA